MQLSTVVTAPSASDDVSATPATISTDAAVPTVVEIERSFQGMLAAAVPRRSRPEPAAVPAGDADAWLLALLARDVETWPQARLARNICMALSALNLNSPIRKGMSSIVECMDSN